MKTVITTGSECESSLMTLQEAIEKWSKILCNSIFDTVIKCQPIQILAKSPAKANNGISARLRAYLRGIVRCNKNKLNIRSDI